MRLTRALHKQRTIEEPPRLRAAVLHTGRLCAQPLTPPIISAGSAVEPRLSHCLPDVLLTPPSFELVLASKLAT